VRGEARRKGDLADNMNFDNTSYRVQLKLPRRVSLAVNGVSDSVRVGEIDGAIRLSNVRRQRHTEHVAARRGRRARG
jgi:hypothetical protein